MHLFIQVIKKKWWRNYRLNGRSDSGPPCQKAFEASKIHQWIGEYFRKRLSRLLLWYQRKVQRIYRWDNRRYSERFPLHLLWCWNESSTSTNSQDKRGEQLNFMYCPCKNTRNDSKVCCPLIGQKNTKVFWHQSEARTAATVWNWSGKTLSQGLFTFLRTIFPARLRLSLAPTICPWVSQDGFFSSLVTYSCI